MKYETSNIIDGCKIRIDGVEVFHISAFGHTICLVIVAFDGDQTISESSEFVDGEKEYELIDLVIMNIKRRIRDFEEVKKSILEKKGK